jgi:CubicO group peptidase (beta-lactamase class C family)
MIAAIVSTSAAEKDDRNDARTPGSLYFPPTRGTWETITPASSGWNGEKIDEALDKAGKSRSSGVVILFRGRIMAERYWNLDGLPEPEKGKGAAQKYSRLVVGRDAAGHVIEDVASIQKSVASILVGIGQEKGLLNISDPVRKYLGAGWSKTSPEQESAITVRHLLTMSSGLADDLTFEAAAGNRWRYNTAAYAFTMKVLAAAAKKPREELTREWLTERIGMTDSKWVKRTGSGEENPINDAGFATTARDLARFGLMILADGQWGDQKVIGDRAYLKAALHPSQELNPSYGYLWWLNGQAEVARGAGAKSKGPLIPSAPSDLVAALGAVDRKLYIVPSLGLVVTRLGANTGPAFDNEFWKALMAAAPAPSR